MAIPSEEICEAGRKDAEEIKARAIILMELLSVARDRGTVCNGIAIPLGDDQVQPLIDEYQAVKAEAAVLFQGLP